MEVLLTRLPSGALAPTSDDEAEKLRKVKTGALVRADIKQMRNPKFHRKFFALLNFVFGIWEDSMPQQKFWRGRPVKANFERFRKDLIILTGRHEVTYDIQGGVHLEAHSISFGSMGEDEFEKLYSDVIQVSLSKVIDRPDLDEAKLRRIIDELLRFD